MWLTFNDRASGLSKWRIDLKVCFILKFILAQKHKNVVQANP